MMQEAQGKAQRATKKHGARPGDTDREAGFPIAAHMDLNLSAKESTEKLAEWFSAIGHQYAPHTIENLEERLRVKTLLC